MKHDADAVRAAYPALYPTSPERAAELKLPPGAGRAHDCEISKTFSFDAAHQLPHHDGKCRNLHGHTYSVTVRLTGRVQGYLRDPKGAQQVNPEHGMVLDYRTMKEVVKPIIDQLDHSFLVAGDEPVLRTVLNGTEPDSGSQTPGEADSRLRHNFGKITVIGQRTTAENLARWITTKVAQGLLDLIPQDPHLVGSVIVSVSETPNTTATAMLAWDQLFGERNEEFQALLDEAFEREEAEHANGEAK